MKPFTTLQVLQAWLETQIGTAKNIRPKGYDSRGEGAALWRDTCSRAAGIVEFVPLYSVCRQDIIDWMFDGSGDDGRLGMYLLGLERHLRDYPFYPTTELPDRAKHSVEHIESKVAAKKLGVSESCLLARLRKRETSLPHGSYKYERKWFIHPLDLGHLGKRNS